MASVSTIIAIAMLMVHALGSDSAGHSNLTTVSSSVESIVNGVLEVDERGGSSQTQHSNVTLQHHIKPKLKWESRLPDTGTEARWVYLSVAPSILSFWPVISRSINLLVLITATSIFCMAKNNTNLWFLFPINFHFVSAVAGLVHDCTIPSKLVPITRLYTSRSVMELCIFLTHRTGSLLSMLSRPRAAAILVAAG